MEEERAAAYYDELTRKGEGAARFKQGLGFSSSASADAALVRGSAIASSSSFLNQFVKASSNPKSAEKNHDKDSEIRSVRDKLKKKNPDENQQHREIESNERRRYRSRERDERDRNRSRRSRSRSRSVERRRESRRRRRSRSRSLSPRRERRRNEDERRGRRREDVKEKKKKIDYSRLIKGYDEMSNAEKVKAKMKLQLDETSEKDTSKGAGWERFEFDKDALMDDEEVEGADDDAALVKRMGQSFRFSAIEARREEELKAAHDEAMFGIPTRQSPTENNETDVAETSNVNDDKGESNSGTISLLSEKVLAKQQGGSWRDRARKS